MVVVENLASTLRGILTSRSFPGEATQWRILGHERGGGLVMGWVQSGSADDTQPQSCIGIYHRHTSSLQILYQFDGVVNTVQATVNSSKTALVYVTKDTVGDTGDNSELEVYRAFAVQLGGEKTKPPVDISVERSLQVAAQFLYKNKEQPDDVCRFLLFIHHESIAVYQFNSATKNSDGIEIETNVSVVESVVRCFTWAQWDPQHQALFYIHYRKPAARLEEIDPSSSQGKADEAETQLAPTLSGLQFHDNMPHETVFNIPLNLPVPPRSASASNSGHPGTCSSMCSVYEDDFLPLRVRDCSLDLSVVTDPQGSGVVCICHHYLYQPASQSFAPEDSQSSVHLAYSVTLLHHGCVLHCVAPGIPWQQARRLRPSFTLLGAHHMIVHAQGLFTHILDIGLSHEPCCHIMLNSDALSLPLEPGSARLVSFPPSTLPTQVTAKTSTTGTKPTKGAESVLTVDLTTLNLVPLVVTPALLLRAFRAGFGTSKALRHLDNQLAIVHYVQVHIQNSVLLNEMISCISAHVTCLGGPQLLQEILVGGAYAAVKRNLSADALPLLALLPLTVTQPATRYQEKDDRENEVLLTLTQETLWNTAMMLLSPQQRLVPYRSDIWTHLYDSLAAANQHRSRATCSMDSRPFARFRPTQVADKLMVSLVCYQPEALSRCSTPLSPGGNLIGAGAALSDVAAITSTIRRGSTGSACGGAPAQDYLPFLETESCTASKQEHVISVNLRELSMHLLKQSARGQSPLNVHAVATGYVASQLEVSRSLCRALCVAAFVHPQNQTLRGFALIDDLDEFRRRLLFLLLEQLLLAVDTLAFPLPQGFSSFFTYLGYRTLDEEMFWQYAMNHVFELQIDAMKAIMLDVTDDSVGVSLKLRLLQLLPRSRARRLLNQWTHNSSICLRAREHALHVLSGLEGGRQSSSAGRAAGGGGGGGGAASTGTSHSLGRNARGLAAFPSADRLSPLDTFLDLLTAKASLAELDFGLLIEATIASTEELSW